MLLAALGVVCVGALLPASPLARVLGFQPLPAPFFLALIQLVIAYLALIELGKHWFYRAPTPSPARHRDPHHRVHRRAARFTASTHPPHRSRSPATALTDSEAR